MDGPGGHLRTVDKPGGLLALDRVTEELFSMLRAWFDVPPTVALDLREVDSAVEELGDPVLIAAMAMRKLQALHLLSTPGVRTTTDVVVTIVGDLDRALIQAPAMRLKRRAAETDWDRELAMLREPGIVAGSADPVPNDPAAADEEADGFRELHHLLHRAVQEVIEVSDGEICYLV
jgi:hypothetical protein